MKKIILIFFLLSGCSYNQTEVKDNFANVNFSNDLSFEEFKIKLENYAKNSPYPNIDN
jgi:hypothetical protein|tara:strand:- start:159 stop:332 length:174 start_codon:yes stop_codon:yes gene_type:complete